jgi:flagellar hook-associated protein 2
VSSTLGTTSSTSTGSDVVYGTNVPPISFPGIASGIDYNSIISKYSSMTMSQATPLETQVTKLNTQETELAKIQTLISTLQGTFAAISAPANFTQYNATSTDSSLATATAISGQTATPGAYTITSDTLATATKLINSPSANGTFNMTVPLDASGAAVIPDNGTYTPSGSSTTEGQLTINGVTISYNVGTDTFAQLQARIAANVPGVTLSNPNANGQVTLTSANGPLTIGGPNDSGNILQVLKLDSSPITQAGTSYSVTSSASIAGIDVGSNLNANNNAGFATAVTGGTFTINGVQFTVSPTTQNLNDILNEINNSSAGVVATYNSSSNQVILTSKTTGPQSISLGAASTGTPDTSNFLQAIGWAGTPATPGTQAPVATGATETVGTEAVVHYIDTSGNNQVAYSASNDVTNVVPGITVNLLQSTPASSNGFTINVAQSYSNLTSAINSFVTAYNAVINEINTATQAPVIGDSTDTSTGSSTATQLTSGGVLFGNMDVQTLKDSLVNYVSEMGKSGSSGYNSLASIGLSLDNSFSVATAGSSKDSTSLSDTSTPDSVSSTSYGGTSGALSPLDSTTLTTALQADPNAVKNLFTAQNNPIYDLATYLTTTSGLPTLMANDVSAGTVPPQSLFTELTSSTQDQIDSLQQQIAVITNQTNMQANALRAEFTSSETQIAQLQVEQQSLGSLTGTTSSG